jgi:CheY-like chemotaxis protein
MAALVTNLKDEKGALPHGVQAQSERPLVLVVEDHEDTCFLLNYLLNVRGYRVSTARNGEEAVWMAEAEHPSLILMDISLPRLDGLSAAQRIRQTALLASVPLVFLSGHDEVSFRDKAMAHGDDYLLKPFALSELERILERFKAKSVTAKAQ